MADTDKIAPKVNSKQDDAAYSLLKTIGRLGGLGTFTLGTLIVGGFGWLEGKITEQTKNIVREEVRPIDDRLRKVEIEQEVQKRLKESK